MPGKIRFRFYWLLLIILILRVTTLTISFADHDEGSYWVTALEMLRGESLYTDLIDIKPPGIFYIFYGLAYLGLDQVIVFRILALISIAFGGWATGKAAGHLFSNQRLEWPAGLLFLFSFCNPMSVSLNTELVFVPLLAGAFYFGLRDKPWLSGLLAGLAFITKTLAVTDAFVIGLFILIISNSGKLKWRSFISYTIAGAIPFLILNLVYYLSPHWEDFVFVIYELPFSYSAEKKLKPFVDMLAVYQWRYIWVAIPAYIYLFRIGPAKKIPRNQTTIRLLGLWIILDWLVILMPNKIHFHYWLQLAPAMAIAASPVALYLIDKVQFTKRTIAITALLFVILTSILNWNYRKIYEPHDSYLYNLLDQIDEVRQPEDSTLWILNLPASLYKYTNSPCPTPYVHSTLLVEPSHLRAFQIDTPAAWKDACKNADMIVWKRNKVSTEPAILKVISETHEKVLQADHLVSIYRRKPKR